jgi:hypothetical protein
VRLESRTVHIKTIPDQLARVWLPHPGFPGGLPLPPVGDDDPALVLESITVASESGGSATGSPAAHFELKPAVLSSLPRMI